MKSLTILEQAFLQCEAESPSSENISDLVILQARLKAYSNLIETKIKIRQDRI